VRNPFAQRNSSHLRVVCQIVRVATGPDGTLIDLITLEPLLRDGERLAAGTPFALTFTAAEPAAQVELDATVRVWEQACAVIDVAVDESPAGLRYEFATDHHQLVVTVDDPSAF
jgi:hypothetical protein